VLSNLIDVRHKLATNPRGGPGVEVEPTRRLGIVIHYSGPPTNLGMLTDLQIIQNEAVYHVSKDWDEDETNPTKVEGDGLMYHLAIGREGERYQCRDWRRVLWHAGTRLHNYQYYSIHVPIGGTQRATAKQLASLAHACDEIIAAHPGQFTRADVIGHMEASKTACPGTLMGDFVLPYRRGAELGKGYMADVMWFEETQCSLGGGFLVYWQRNGGLLEFGYPLTSELREVGPDKVERTVQYFERAVFRFFPENADPYRVQIDRLGAHMLALVQAAAGSRKDFDATVNAVLANYGVKVPAK
jgi:hypothetical protein